MPGDGPPPHFIDPRYTCPGHAPPHDFDISSAAAMLARVTSTTSLVIRITDTYGSAGDVCPVRLRDNQRWHDDGASLREWHCRRLQTGFLNSRSLPRLQEYRPG